MNKNTELFYENVIVRKMGRTVPNSLEEVVPLTENIIGALDDLQGFAERVNKEEDFEHTLDVGRTVSTTMASSERRDLFSLYSAFSTFSAESSESVLRHFRGREVLKMLYDPTLVTDKDILSIFDDVCPNLAKGFTVRRDHAYKQGRITADGVTPNRVTTMQYIITPGYTSNETECSISIMDQEIGGMISIGDEECARFVRWLTLVISRIPYSLEDGIVIDLNKIPNSNSKRFEDIEFQLIFDFKTASFRRLFTLIGNRMSKDPYIKTLATGVITRYSKNKFMEQEGANE